MHANAQPVAVACDPASSDQAAPEHADIEQAASRPVPKRFVSESSADPEEQTVWIRRGERLGDALQAISTVISNFSGKQLKYRIFG